jgi:hypothetical protein
MATDEALVYLVALSVPVWLLVEHGVAWLRSRKHESRRTEAAPIAAAAEGDPAATRKAA